MIPREHTTLSPYTTFRIGGPARFFTEVKTAEEAHEAVAFAKRQKLPLLPLGGGANLLVPDEGVEGLVAKIEISEELWEEERESTKLIAGAGVSWDHLVEEASRRGLWGIENLAGIPGTLGGAVVQNIGAYGAELSEVFLFADTLDSKTGEEKRLFRKDCVFGYRESVFKKRPELLIIRAALVFSKKGNPRVTYPDLAFQVEQGKQFGAPADVAHAVREIRAGKFPDIRTTGTAGSFFKNPIVSAEVAAKLAEKFPGLKHFPQRDGREKIALAWILDHALFLKGYAHGHVRLFERQPLVIVAESGATAKEVEALARSVEERVFAETRITIEREVEAYGGRTPK